MKGYRRIVKGKVGSITSSLPLNHGNYKDTYDESKNSRQSVFGTAPRNVLLQKKTTVMKITSSESIALTSRPLIRRLGESCLLLSNQNVLNGLLNIKEKPESIFH